MGERFFFDFTYFSERYQLYFIAKLCYAIMIWFFIKYSLKLISKIINDKKKYIEIILPSILVIIFYVIIFLCLYPGIWIGDEYFVLGEASRFSYSQFYCCSSDNYDGNSSSIFFKNNTSME